MKKNNQFIRQGIISLSHGDYVFRCDHAGEIKYWAWRIEPIVTDRSQCYKWQKIPKDVCLRKPKGYVILFNLESPPRTVPYLPILE